MREAGGDGEGVERVSERPKSINLMTQAELDALPDVTLVWGQREEIIDGRRVVTPVILGEAGAIYMAPEDGTFLDEDGDRWMVGHINGRRVRRRFWR